MATGTSWTNTENAALVRSYLDMLRLELAGVQYSKTQFRRAVQAHIQRSEGAIEYKLQNVSAALYEVNHPFIDGYKPAKNLQDSLRAEVLLQLDSAPDIEDLAFAAMRRMPKAHQTDYVWSLTGAPEVELSPTSTRARTARRFDFVRIDAENRALGLAGEQAVLVRERGLLSAGGRADLAARVEHVSQTMGDGLGFDVLSFTPNGSERYLEVKTTRQGKNWPMQISRNEVELSKEEPKRFELHRVFNFEASRVGLYVLEGDINRTCRLDPLSYRAVPA